MEGKGRNEKRMEGKRRKNSNQRKEGFDSNFFGCNCVILNTALTILISMKILILFYFFNFIFNFNLIFKLKD